MTRVNWIWALAVTLVAAPAFADDKDLPKIDPQKAMEAMMKAATPGEFHKKLEPLAGEWEITTKFWMEPGQPPMESKGTAKHTWTLGNRYLRQAVKGDFGGMPFEGVGVMGYDNLEKKYVGAWIDNMGTGIMQSTGAVDKSGKVFTMNHEEIDPALNQKFKGKDVTTVIDEDTHKTEFYRIMGDKEIKIMEIVYKRKK